MGWPRCLRPAPLRAASGGDHREVSLWGLSYAASPRSNRSFALPAEPGRTGRRPRIIGQRRSQTLGITRSWRTWVTSHVSPVRHLGGWTPSIHHTYDSRGYVLYEGQGQPRTASALPSDILIPVAGTGKFGFTGDGGPASEARLARPRALAWSSDGSLYMADRYNRRIRRVDPDGIITTVAGAGIGWVRGNGDGGPATQAYLKAPSGLAWSGDGSLYIADRRGHRIRRVDPDGIITTEAGTGVAGFRGDGGPAVTAELNASMGLAFDRAGALYIADSGNRRIRRLSPGGRLVTVAGGGTGSSGGPALEARLVDPRGIVLDPQGSLYIADRLGHRIFRVSPSGWMTTVAGTDTEGFGGDGGPATQAQLTAPQALAFDAAGALYIADSGNRRIRRVGADGRITTVAGTAVLGGDRTRQGIPAMQAWIEYPSDVAVAPDGRLHIAEPIADRVRRLAKVWHEVDPQQPRGVSRDGQRLFEFDAHGRHLRTLDTMTGAQLYQFRYNAAGALIEIEDVDEEVTRIERGRAGQPLAIVAPTGQRTELTLDANGYLASVSHAAHESYHMQYTPDGLMTAFTDPRQHHTRFTYFADGRLQSDVNAAGGGWQLRRTEAEAGFISTLSSAEGRGHAFRVEHLPSGERRQTQTAPDGTVSRTLFRQGWRETATRADGTHIEVTKGPGPRFGMLAPVAEQTTISTPSGLKMTVKQKHLATLADPTDLLSHTRLSEELRINERGFGQVFERATRTYTQTSSQGRVSTTMVDAKHRPIRTQVGGLYATGLTYLCQRAFGAHQHRAGGGGTSTPAALP